MKNSYLTLASVILPLFCSPNLLGAETNDTTITDLTNLVAKINAKLVAGKTNEADYADNFKEFDALLAKHKDAKPEELTQIVVADYQLYFQVFDDPEPALELLKRVKHDYPTVQPNGNMERVIKGLESLVAQRKIWHSLAVGTKFPNFTAMTLASRPLSLSEYNSNVVLIDFWITESRPCQAELPDLFKTYSKHHSQGFDNIGVSLDDNPIKALGIVTVARMPWPQICDGQGWKSKLVARYGVYHLPSTFLLDGQGTIIGKDLQGDALEQAVAKALAKK